MNAFGSIDKEWKEYKAVYPYGSELNKMVQSLRNK